MLAAYREREIVGGVYVIRNTRSGQKFFDATTDIRASRNRFEFAQKNNLCADRRIEEEWKKWGAAAFVFEAVEELTKGATQTMEEFQTDVAALKELRLEKPGD